MLVHIVYAPTPDRLGPDLTRMGTVEDVPDEVGRAMLGDGSARKPTEEEVAEFDAARQVETKADEAGDLTTLTKAELLELAESRQVEVPANATKADIARALDKADKAPPAEPTASDTQP